MPKVMADLIDSTQQIFLIEGGNKQPRTLEPSTKCADVYVWSVQWLATRVDF